VDSGIAQRPVCFHIGDDTLHLSFYRKAYRKHYACQDKT
jgi:hypothetical protein